MCMFYEVIYFSCTTTFTKYIFDVDYHKENKKIQRNYNRKTSLKSLFSFGSFTKYLTLAVIKKIRRK